MRIRRLIIDKCGSLEKLPIISFVAIDTDKNSLKTSGLRTGNTYQGEEICFSSSEMVGTTLSASDVNTYRRELLTEYQSKRPGPCTHIRQWFPQDLLKDLNAVENGANGIRPVARLAFFHNHRQIQEAVENADNRTRGHKAELLKRGLDVEEGLDIFVIGSMCGGTGSGMFLDIAYYLKKLFVNQETQVFGYFIVSPQLYGNTDNMNANTYAALKELNYYTTPTTNFLIWYDQKEQGLNYSGQPFNYTYLVSNLTTLISGTSSPIIGDYKILEKGKLCNVIAHKITLEFLGELAPYLRGNRNNYDELMISSDDHPLGMVQRYLTFGLASIHFTREKILSIALNRINLKLIQFWLYGKGQSPSQQTLLARFLTNWNSDKLNRRSDNSNEHYFILKLEELTQNSNKTFYQYLKNWKTNIETDISACKNQDDMDSIISNTLPYSLQNEFRKVQPGETERIRGVWLTELQQTRLNLIEKIKIDIDEFWYNLLNPSDLDFCLNNTLNWLEALLTTINNYQRDFEEEKEQFGNLYRTEAAERELAQIRTVLNDVKEQKKLPFFGNSRQLNNLKTEAISGVQKFYKLIKHNFDVTLIEESLKICQTLQHHIQFLLNQTNQLNSLLKSLEMFYERNESDLKQVNFDEMSGEAIFPEEDIDEFYNKIIQEQESNRTLVFVSVEVLNKFDSKNSLVLLLTPNLVEEQDLKQIIKQTIDEKYKSIGVTVQSVIKRFWERYSVSERPRRLEQIIRESESLLPLDLNDAYFKKEISSKSKQIIGFRDKDDSEVRNFKNLLIKDLSVDEITLRPIQAEDEIIFVKEYGAFPLRIIKSLEMMRNLYERQKEKSFLHNDDYIDFFDVIPPEADTVRNIEYTFYPCLALELLEYNMSINQYILQYKNPYYDANEPIFLSYVWHEAIEFLAKRQDIYQLLVKKLEQFKQEIIKDQEKWYDIYISKIRKFYKKLDSLAKEDPNYNTRTRVVGEQQPVRIGIIPYFCDEIEQILAEQQYLPELSSEINNQLKLSSSTDEETKI